MTIIDMEFNDEEFEALDAIIRDNGGEEALKSAIKFGLLLLVDEKTLEEKNEVFSENYISTEHRERILAGESLVSIANGLTPKSESVNPEKEHTDKEIL